MAKWCQCWKKRNRKEKVKWLIPSVVVFLCARHASIPHRRISYAFPAPWNNQSHPSLQWRSAVLQRGAADLSYNLLKKMSDKHLWAIALICCFCIKQKHLISSWIRLQKDTRLERVTNRPLSPHVHKWFSDSRHRPGDNALTRFMGIHIVAQIIAAKRGWLSLKWFIFFFFFYIHSRSFGPSKLAFSCEVNKFGPLYISCDYTWQYLQRDWPRLPIIYLFINCGPGRRGGCVCVWF